MRFFVPVVVSAAIGFVSCASTRAEESAEEAKRFAEDAIKIGAIDYLTDREFKLDGDDVKAKAHAIDPKKNIKIKLKDFDFSPGSVKIKFKLDCRFRFEGSVAASDKATDVHGEANMGQLISLEAKYFVDNRGVHIDAKALDMKFSAKILEMTPEDAAGGKEAATKLVVKQISKQRKELIRAFNEWQAEYQRKAG